jgi:hypothetical protein
MLKRFFVLLPPISELVPFVVPDALLDPALLNGFAGNCVSVGPNRYTVCLIQICILYSRLLFADLMLELFIRFRGHTLPSKLDLLLLAALLLLTKRIRTRKSRRNTR